MWIKGCTLIVATSLINIIVEEVNLRFDQIVMVWDFFVVDEEASNWTIVQW